MKFEFTGQLQQLINKAQNGSSADVDYIMEKLTAESSFAMTRYVDFALSLVDNKEGIERIKFYLFNGTLIQRNYASLFFNRLGDCETVQEAFDKGFIDKIQAWTR